MRILLIQYSLSGETHKATEEFLRGIQDEYEKNNQSDDATAGVEICQQDIQLEPIFKFPWTFWSFFDIMPETVVTDLKWRNKRYKVVPPNSSSLIGKKQSSFDLIVLGWQTWYLSPSLPIQLALEDSQYQTLISNCQNIVLVGTHRNMWHHASKMLCRSLLGNDNRIVGQINFVQSSPFLTSVVQTLQRQLGGKSGLQTTAQEQAYQEGRQFAKHYQKATKATATSTTDKAVSVYHGGKPYNKVLSFCEEVWFPCKRAAGKIMGYFEPGSFGRKIVALVYIPMLLSAIVGLAPPVLLIGGSLAGLQSTTRSTDDKKLS